ncbi:hypothetical protein LIER_41963 [Lithospermum erythrorhizon]|uniref:Reverse transcriptase n=1 Tax=Lithospermum erythrorhizon TaxID=34254 RepID=A0AAV3RIQ9_LITER
MLAMGFPQRFIFLLQCRVTKASFSINLNGTMSGWKASGDPEFKFHPRCQQLGITHLSFVDDMIHLASADMASFRIIKETLSLFGDLTGLRFNCSKSMIFFGSTPEATKIAL